MSSVREWLNVSEKNDIAIDATVDVISVLRAIQMLIDKGDEKGAQLILRALWEVHDSLVPSAKMAKGILDLYFTHAGDWQKMVKQVTDRATHLGVDIGAMREMIDKEVTHKVESVRDLHKMFGDK